METEVKKNNKKGLIITLSIIGVLAIILIAGFIYINKTFNANSFVNRMEKEINKEIEELLNFNDFANNFHLEDNDIISNIDLSFTTNEDTLNELNDLKLNIVNEIDAKKEYSNTFVELLKKNDSVIKGNIIVNNDGIYLDSNDIFDKTLKLETTTANDNELKEIMALTNINNLKYFAVKSVQYFATSIKEANMKTSKDGFKVTYEFEINNETRTKIINKLNELINDDTKYQEIMKQFNITINDIEKELEDATITITENMLNKEIEEFVIKNKTDVLTGKRENDNLFTIKDEENNKIKIETIDDVTTIVIEEINKEPINIVITNKKDTITYEVTESNNKAIISINEIKDNKYKMEISLESSSINLKGNMDININKDKIEYTGKMNASAKDTTFGIVFTINQEVGKGIITKKDTTKSIDANKLSESEQTLLMTNLLSKLSKLDTFNKMIGLF